MDDRLTTSCIEKGSPFLCDTFAYIATDIRSMETLDLRISALIEQAQCTEAADTSKMPDTFPGPGILYTILHTKKSGWYFWSTDSMRGEKVYINYRFRGFANDVVSQVWLKEGDNLIAVELSPQNPQPVVIRFSPVETEKSADISVFFTNNLSKGMYLHILDKGYAPLARGIYEFYLVPATYEMIDPARPVRVEVMEMPERKLLDSFFISFETWGSVDLSKYEYMHDRLSFLAVRFLYRTSIGIEWVMAKPFSFYPMQENAERFLTDLKHLRLSEGIGMPVSNAIDYYLQELKNTDLSSFSALQQLVSVSKAINDLLSKTEEEYYRSPGMVYLYIRSKLDGKIIKVPVCVPKQYDPATKWPLVIHHDIVSYGANCASIKAPGCLAVNMTGRGITFGGYIGEACFFEILSEIKRIYPIDDSRIYGMGHCNAAAAVLTLAHNHPDLYAGVLLSECMDIPSDLRNTGDMKIIALYSDRTLSEDKPAAAAAALSQLPACEMHIMKASTHDMLMRCFFQEHLIRQLVNSKRKEKPDCIHFETYSNRYTKSAWLTTDGIADPHEPAVIDAEARTNHHLRIYAKNVTGFSIERPFGATGVRFASVNGKMLPCPSGSAESLHFSGKDGVWTITEKSTSTPDAYIGLGLLDVYLSPLLIWNRAWEDNYAKQTAQAFSSPKVLAYHPDLNVKYPIVSDVSENDMTEHAVIIIDDLAKVSSSLLDRIKSRLLLKCHMDGYQLCGEYFHGDYCVMEVTANPWNRRHSIVYICANRISLLHENLFTRAVRLPALSSGRHPYLNKRILIFRDREYITVG